MKKHLGFIIFFAAIIFIFLYKLIFMKAAFLYGDYLGQFYPWSEIYSEAIKNFGFPFWIRYVNSGFPLMAEGQIGGFYPLNILVFFSFPVHIAYNYSLVIHFILAGVFTYIYTRKIGADQYGASLSVLLFCFGSTYAGCFYNIITLHTLIWFPLCLFLIEKYFENKKIKYILFLGVIFGIQLLAGFVQMAIYSVLFYVVYFFYGLGIKKAIKLGDFIKLGLALLISGLLSLPQVMLSLRLAGLSTRMQGSLGFALWGSFNPVNLISLCLPSVIFYGSQFYIGIFSLAFLISGIYALKKESRLRPLAAILFTAVFFAFGGYNPFYIFFLKITKFYSLRNPAKFIFFAAFAASVLSGAGFTYFFKLKNIETRNHILNIFSMFIGIMLTIFIFAKTILYLLKDKIIDIGTWYAKHYIFGKDYHRRSLDFYLYKVKVIHEQLISDTSFSNVFILISLFLLILAMLLSRYLIKKQEFNRAIKNIFIIIIFLDIFIFSLYGIGFRGNMQSFDSLKPTHNKILQILQSDKSLFRILPYWYENGNMPWWSKPCANILVRLDSVASYSPLIQKSYKDEVGPLEVVDTSLGVLYPSPDVIKAKYKLLRLLNVKYIISAHPLNFDFLKQILFEEEVYLYEFKDYLPRIFFAADLGVGNIELFRESRIIKYTDGSIEVQLTADKDGFCIFSENYYPGWNVYVDGLKKENIKFANLIQAVAINKGKHKVIFKYRPF